MKNKTLFIIVIFVAALCSNSFLVAQNQSVATSLQSVGQNNSDDSYSLNNQATPLLDQNSSPLMMFRAGEKAEQKTSERERDDERSRAARGAASSDSSSGEARGTFSGIAEDEGDDDSLTLDHFRRALDEHPEARRFIIFEDEENENAISIQPRAAATSRLALKRNQADNETIIEALRELLVIRHGGNEEVVKSFFGEQKENTPLTAAELSEILRRSDAAQNSKTASQKIASQTSQIASPFHTLESEQTTSKADDSNVGSNIDEDLGKDIRGHLHTLEKINLAESFSEKSAQAEENFKQLQKNQKLERRKIREQKVLASAIVSDTEGYLTPGTFLKRAVLKTTQAEVATSVLKGSISIPEIKKLSGAERDIEDFTRIAEEKRTKARKASLDASKAKKKATNALSNNLEQEDTIYAAAEEAWSDTVQAYEEALKKAIKAAIETKELTTASDEATAHVLYFQSARLEISAKEHEQTSPTSDAISLHQAEALESAWHQAHQGYQEAITKAQAVVLTDEVEEWGSDLANAETKKTFWAEKVNQLKINADLEGAKIQLAIERGIVEWKTKRRLSLAVSPITEEIIATWSRADAECFEQKRAIEKLCTSYKRKNYAGTDILDSAIACFENAKTFFQRAYSKATLGEPELAASWGRLAEQYKFAAESDHQDALDLFASKKEEKFYVPDGKYRSYIYRDNKDRARSLELATQLIEKASVIASTKQLRLPELASIWKEVVEQHQSAAEYYYLEAVGKCYFHKGTKEQIRTDPGYAAKESADLLKLAAEALEQAVILESIDESSIAELWRKTSMQYQLLAYYQNQNAEVFASGDIKSMVRRAKYLININGAKGMTLNDKAPAYYSSSWSSLNSASKALEQASFANSLRNSALTNAWKELAMQYQLAADRAYKAAVMCAQGNDKKGECFREISAAAFHIARQLDYTPKIIRAFESAQEATIQGNQLVSNLWNQVAVQYEATAGYIKKLGSGRYDVISSSEKSAGELMEAIIVIKKAIKAAEYGNQALSDLWNQCVEPCQIAAEYYRQAAEVYVIENEENKQEGDRLTEAAKNIHGYKYVNSTNYSESRNSDWTHWIPFSSLLDLEDPLLCSAWIYIYHSDHNTSKFLGQALKETKPAGLTKALESIQAAKQAIQLACNVVDITKQEAVISASSSQADFKVAEDAFVRAQIEKSVLAWDGARIEALKVSSYWSNIISDIKTGRNQAVLTCEKVIQEKKHWTQKATLAQVKSLAVNFLKDKEVRNKHHRTNEIMKLIKNNLWANTEEEMEAFIEHPSEDQMLVASKAIFVFASAFASASDSLFDYVNATEPSLISCSTSKKTEIADSASIVEVSKTAAAAVREWSRDDDLVANINWSTVATSKLVEFAQAVAAFKARKEEAQGSGSSSAIAASSAGAGADAGSSSSSSSSGYARK